MSGNHSKTLCSCGAVIAQCRCFSPSKTVTVVAKGCKACGERVKRFEVGPPLCMLTLELVAECPHCAELAKRPKGPGLVVTGVDRETGAVTVESK